MHRRWSPVLAALGLLFCVASTSRAQLLRGPEMVINAARAGRQTAPDVAIAADGRFVAVWVSGGPGAANVMARLLGADGTPKTGDLRVSALDPGFQGHPRVAMAADGRFVVVWSARTSVQAPSRVYGQLFKADGKPVGQRFRLGTSPVHEQFEPDVARMPDGRFIAAWTEDDGAADPQTGDPTTDVMARRFSADGKALAKEWPAAGGRLYQYSPAVAVSSTGAFVIAVEELTATEALDIWQSRVYGKVYGPDAKLRSSLTLPVSVPTGEIQAQAAVAMAADGSCLLAWADSKADPVDSDFWNSPAGILVQRFDAKGVRIGNAIHGNTTTLHVQSEPALVLAPDGGFLVTWTDAGWKDGDNRGVYAQRFAANGTKIGPETLLAAWTKGNQVQTAVAANLLGQGIMVWQSEGSDGSDFGVAGRRVGLKP